MLGYQEYFYQAKRRGPEEVEPWCLTCGKIRTRGRCSECHQPYCDRYGCGKVHIAEGGGSCPHSPSCDDNGSLEAEDVWVEPTSSPEVNLCD